MRKKQNRFRILRREEKNKLVQLNVSKISNENIELYQEDGRYYFKVDFDYEDDYAYYKGKIERIPFDFRLYSIKMQSADYLFNTKTKMMANLGLHEDMEIYPNKNGDYFTLTVVKEKTYEMTMEEIEKKLGYKVKIVSKGD